MFEIIEIHQEGGTGHEHITKYKWKSTTDGKIDISDRPQMVTYVEQHPKTVFVQDKKGKVDVVVINGPTHKYLKTVADGRYTDNLLYLPRF